MTESDTKPIKDVSEFVARWAVSGGGEIANSQSFIKELCDLLDLPQPDPSTEKNSHNNYVFERRVDFKHPDGSKSIGRIDLYKRDCFVLESKQSGKRQKQKELTDQLDLLPEDVTQQKLGHAKRGTRSWDTVMVAARRQAENYARALPVEHGYPPFLLIVDVGHVIEVYADFSGQGKNYAHFPDRQSYRLSLEGLADGDIQSRLRTIWSDPLSLDPAKKSAEVTRDIAKRLAKIAKRLEGKHDAKDTAEFLMRCLFTMFAEDVDLLPHDSFSKLLEDMKETPENFVPAMESLWTIMDEGGYAPHLNTTIKRFNGTLFKNRKALPLDAEDIHELWVAARRDWQDVEPAIFGTLLERALDDRERSKLGAHYTPRSYVERLVVPTIIEPLREDWEEVQARVEDLRDHDEPEAALQAVKDFHHQLCTTRVLDPACGTGNFLYVSLELMKRLEGEVLEALEGLGERQVRLEIAGESVDPSQFYGLEINPRAVAIADLVLWIGYLKWQLRTGGPESVTEPVLDAYGTIKNQDAILAYDSRELVRDAGGTPVTIWDRHTFKIHPITEKEVPDESAQMETWTYTNPRKADWPKVEYVVGNPPFIGGKDMRAQLGDDYAEACWSVRPKIPGGADLVMHFWDQAAETLLAKGTELRRFGFITTNSITQTYSSRVIERWKCEKVSLSIYFAISDHPWIAGSDKASVQIAMTVACRGQRDGILARVVAQRKLDSDSPEVELVRERGNILSNLTIGSDFSKFEPLLGNSLLGIKGFMPYGRGFIVSRKLADQLRKAAPLNMQHCIRPYLNGRDLVQRS